MQPVYSFHYYANLSCCLGLLVLSNTGCVSGSLASNTGPAPAGQTWSMASTQWVHVGEEVSFDFVLQDMFGKRVNSLGWADYAAAEFGTQRIEIEPDDAGRFQFTVRIDRYEPGDAFSMRVGAFRQRGARDYMNVQDRWLRAGSPSEIHDEQIAADTIQFKVYEALVSLQIPQSAVEWEPETGVLRLHRSDGTTKSVYIDRPGRPGFVISGPLPDGVYRITYRPTGDEVNRIGTTKAHFLIYDLNGSAHEVETVFDTP